MEDSGYEHTWVIGLNESTSQAEGQDETRILVKGFMCCIGKFRAVWSCPHPFSL